MPSSGMLCHMALVTTDVSEERSASIIMVTRIGGIGTLAVTSNQVTHMVFLHSVRRRLVTANVNSSPPSSVALLLEALCSSEMSVLTIATRRNISKDVSHSHRREKLKSCFITLIHLVLWLYNAC
jgi:hypothetical protein